MKRLMHVTSGDCSGDLLAQSGLPGSILVWRDVVYDGRRKPGWPDEATLESRAILLEDTTGGAMDRTRIMKALRRQYSELAGAAPDAHCVLWFDSCLFDQSMLAHILACLRHCGSSDADLICIDSFPGIEPYNGLGQLSAEQLASRYDSRHPVTAAQFDFADEAERAFAAQDFDALARIAKMDDAPLPWMADAAARWIAEQPDPATGLGRLAKLALDAIRAGHDTPAAIFKAVAAADPPPQYWGDTRLWSKINAMATMAKPLVRIEGPAPLLPQWESPHPLDAFRVSPGPPPHG